MRVASVCLLWLLHLAATAQTPVLGEISDLGSSPLGPALNAVVHAVSIGPDGSVYAGGRFQWAGRGGASHIARWNPGPQAWEPLGSGTNGEVYAVAVGPDGAVYAGGEFTMAGGQSAANVARWDGTAWAPLGAGVNGRVQALVVDADGYVVAGGTFVAPSGTAGGIARWSSGTSQWVPLGGGVSHSDKKQIFVNALAVAPNGDLYVGGNFDRAGGARALGVARWTGDRWRGVGGGITSSYFEVMALALSPGGDLFVGGLFEEAGGVAARNVAQWRPATGAWSALGAGSGLEVEALAVATDGRLYASGSFAGVRAVAQWTGTQWLPLGAGLSWPPSALVAAADGSVIAGGYFHAVGGLGINDGALAANHVARWVPSSGVWTSFGSATSGTVRALATTPGGDLVAVGDFLTVGDIAATHVARRDRASGVWQAMPGPGCFGIAESVAAAPNGDVYVGCTVSTSIPPETNYFVSRWRGGAWTVLGEFNGPVLALTASAAGGVVAGGTFSSVGGVGAQNVARWSGTEWQPLGGGIAGRVYALAVQPDGSLYAGGEFAVAGELPASNVARWHDGAWHALGEGVSSTVRSLALAPGGDLYAGGTFEAAGWQPASRVARWDGTAWHPLGDGVSSEVRALTVALNGHVVVGGGFASAGGQATLRLAAWDPGAEAWYAIGDGLDGTPLALATTPDGWIAVGGAFRSSGGVHMPYLARAVLNTVGTADAPVPLGLELDVWPNPATNTAMARVRSAGTARVALYDLTGRHVATLTQQVLAGDTVVDLPVRDLPAGVYVVRAITSEGSVAARLVVVR